MKIRLEIVDQMPTRTTREARSPEKYDRTMKKQVTPTERRKKTPPSMRTGGGGTNCAGKKKIEI